MSRLIFLSINYGLLNRKRLIASTKVGTLSLLFVPPAIGEGMGIRMQKDGTKLKNAGKVTVFILILVILCIGMGLFFQPVWYSWNNYDTTHGFYEEPENTIETIFLGASITANGVTPMELYEKYGICAYNLGTELQPMLASYYWLEETYRLHSECLKTVVLDTSMFRKTPDKACYRKAIDNMRLSSVKYHAVRDYAEDFDETLSCLIPLFSYHNRWSSIEEEDFTKASRQVYRFTRGYNSSTQQYIDIVLANDDSDEIIATPSYNTEELEETIFNKESMFYLKRMIDFCEEHDIKLVLMKTPVFGGWSSADHNAVCAIAERYQLDFLDFNYEPLLSELEYNNAVNSADGVHMNYYGASKLTAWLGEYLMANCQATDVRGNLEYDYLEEQLQEYKNRIVRSVNFKKEIDPVCYLIDAMKNEECTIFIMVKDEAAMSLSEAQRVGFAELGLTELSMLEYRDSYLAIIDRGRIIYEDLEHSNRVELDSKNAEIELDVVKNNLENINLRDVKADEENQKELSLIYNGKLCDDTLYSIKSGGLLLGNIASCKIDGEEQAQNERGLNIVIYDNLRHMVVDTTVFDTHVSSIRDSLNKEIALANALDAEKEYEELSDELQALYLYNLRCERIKESALLKEKVGNDGMLDFINHYRNEDGIALFISVMDDAAGALDGNARSEFEKIGLMELSALEYRDSYLAVIDDGQVIFEQRDHGVEPISVNTLEYSITSGGLESGNTSSIFISGSEYSMMQRGFNIAVYDKKLQMVINTASFDTYAIPIRVESSDMLIE